MARMGADERMIFGIGIAIGIGIVSFFVFPRSCGPSSFPHPGLGTRFLPIPIAIATPIPMVAVTGDGGVSPPSPSVPLPTLGLGRESSRRGREG
jgi:hypothetical protein